jgi:hypothetical protein
LLEGLLQVSELERREPGEVNVWEDALPLYEEVIKAYPRRELLKQRAGMRGDRVHPAL